LEIIGATAAAEYFTPNVAIKPIFILSAEELISYKSGFDSDIIRRSVGIEVIGTGPTP